MLHGVRQNRYNIIIRRPRDSQATTTYLLRKPGKGWMIEFTTDQWGICLDDNAVFAAVCHNGLLLTQRMKLQTRPLMKTLPATGQVRAYLNLIHGGGLQAGFMYLLQVLDPAKGREGRLNSPMGIDRRRWEHLLVRNPNRADLPGFLSIEQSTICFYAQVPPFVWVVDQEEIDVFWRDVFKSNPDPPLKTL